MNKIEIIYHSGYGHTKKVAVAEASGGAPIAIDAEGNLPEGGWERLAAADAIVFGSPTYMGNVSLGGYSGLLTASPSDASPDEMVPGDIATAKLFGQRIVEVVTQFIK
jgi:hypothetical protein